MRTAPPIDPGTPTAHSKPVRPAAAVRRATTGSDTPPPAATGHSVPGHSPPAAELVAGITTSPSRAAIEIATPGKPSSLTSMFEPRPTTSTGMPVAERTSAIAARSSSPDTSTYSAARPPTRYVVIGASGTSCCRRSPRRSASIDAAVASAASTITAGAYGRPAPRRAARRCHRTPSRCTRRRPAPRRRGTRSGRCGEAATPHAPWDARRARR